MDPLEAAARALTAGDPLGALNCVALRDDAPALALRGIALAQLGDLTRAKTLVRRAARAFGGRAPLARARCVVAEAEIALAVRDLGWPPRVLDAARATLEAAGDRVNAAHARYLASRRLLLIGRLDEAERMLAGAAPDTLPPALRTAHELVVAGIAIRRMQSGAARASLARAAAAARRAAIPALLTEVERAVALLEAPVARRIDRGNSRPLRLAEVEALLASEALVIDACRHAVCQAGAVIPLSRRPVLFALARELAEAFPRDVPRDVLIERAFRMRHVDATHRARLRVEMGRLRAALRSVAKVGATPAGYALVPGQGRAVVVLARTAEERHAAVLALLADGESWSSSALALALGASQRTVQRALDALAASGKVQPIGHGRARRWATPVPEITTTLLLPALSPSQ
ncbi:helix-turn-helix domain-containing protein [Cupriavidus sp. AU9028]|uniref:helix-turn-helix domain-containing protein n=1 Tax=Cupriavidus sp. AU9028 TaxID=2871157 RepID=UPI001C94885A|nr:helix-turn-helix domain-containing protein [Cupriavidus sp. AU9028]MBY4897036.1 helix-turn-helix domain-containing protein [Cupriavidus sp. AU9028]